MNMKRTPLKRKTPLKSNGVKLKRTKIRLVGHSTTSELKKEIQAILRQIVIARDGGCILRFYPETGKCDQILQAEHLHSRSHAISFSDSRLIVCLCRRHHIFWKPQYSDIYYKIVRKHIGTIRSILLDRVQNDYTPHKVDLKLELIALKQELKKYEQNN